MGREAIQRWADHRDRQIVARHEVEDGSGETQDRPGLGGADLLKLWCGIGQPTR